MELPYIANNASQFNNLTMLFSFCIFCILAEGEKGVMFHNKYPKDTFAEKWFDATSK